MLKILGYSISIIFILFISIDLYFENSSESIKSIPNFSFFDINTKSFITQNVIDKDRKNVIIHYNSDCQDCLNELDIIQEKVDSCYDYCFIFVSSDSDIEIEKTQRLHFLNSKDNVRFLQDKENKFHSYFKLGFKIYYPHIFIFDKHGKLIFEGESFYQYLKAK